MHEPDSECFYELQKSITYSPWNDTTTWIAANERRRYVLFNAKLWKECAAFVKTLNQKIVFR